MIFLTVFLSLLSSALIYNGSFVYGLVFLIINIFLLIKEKNKKIFYFSLVIFTGFILFLLIKSFLNNINLNYFLVLERKESYAVIFNGFKSFYLNIEDNSTLDSFDIIKIEKPLLEKLDFNVLESGFDFKSYLFSKSVDHQISYEKIEVVFNFPLSFYFMKKNFLDGIKNPIYQNFLSGILFSTMNYDLKETFLVKDLQIITLFSQTGIYLNFILYGLKKIFELKFDEKRAYIYSFLLFLPFLFINIIRFTTIKVITFYIFNFINKFYFNKKFNRVEIISLVGSFFIVISSRIIFQAGFYISFLIYFYLYLTSSKFYEFKPIEKKFATQILLTLIIIPFNISFNNSFNFLSIIFMMILLPFSKVMFIISLLTFLFLPSEIIEWLIDINYRIIYSFDSLKINIFVPKFNELTMIIYYLLLSLFLYFFEINYKKRYEQIALVFLFSASIYILPIENSFSYQVSFINVGQGDSTLIRDRNKTYLIDTGGLTYTDLATNNLIPFLKKNRIYSLDAVIITHYDFDHYGALESLKENFNIKDIYDYNNFDNFKEKNDLNIKNLNDYYDVWTDENDRSLVLYLNLNEEYFLFMGDASKTIEKKIIDEYKSLTVDYLKVSHHGSSSASSLDFLKFINPKEAIILAGKNNFYGHPNKEVLDNLNKCNIKIRRTDLEGTITYKFI